MHINFMYDINIAASNCFICTISPYATRLIIYVAYFLRVFDCAGKRFVHLLYK